MFYNRPSLHFITCITRIFQIQPLQWLGIEDDWEIVALERGSIAVRMLYKLSDIPDLSEKYVPPESE